MSKNGNGPHKTNQVLIICVTIVIVVLICCICGPIVASFLPKPQLPVYTPDPSPTAYSFNPSNAFSQSSR